MILPPRMVRGAEQGAGQTVGQLPAHAIQRIKAGSASLKVPKREIFDRSDFPDFYTIKSLRVGDFGV
jgi:hypothetical protein